MASAAAGRGAQSMNSMYFKPMMRKAAYHRKTSTSDTVMDQTVKLNGDETIIMHKAITENPDGSSWWVRDNRTGIYYPKGQEKVMQDVPTKAIKDVDVINWFD